MGRSGSGEGLPARNASYSHQFLDATADVASEMMWHDEYEDVLVLSQPEEPRAQQRAMRQAERALSLLLGRRRLFSRSARRCARLTTRSGRVSFGAMTCPGRPLIVGKMVRRT